MPGASGFLCVLFPGTWQIMRSLPQQVFGVPLTGSTKFVIINRKENCPIGQKNKEERRV